MKKITTFLSIFTVIFCLCNTMIFAETTTGTYQKLMPVGTGQQLSPTFDIEAGQQILYSLDNEEIVTVNETGEVSALANGLVTITATCGEETLTYTIAVYSNRMEAGTTQQLYCPIEDVIYASSNADVISINETGIVTAISNGEAEIIATAENEIFTYSIEVFTSLTGIDIGDYENEMTVGTYQMLSPTVIPVNAYENAFIFISENEDVATVDESGCLKAISAGSARIVVKCGDISKYLDITVTEKEEIIEVTDLDIESYSNELEVGGDTTLSVKALPTNATNTEITYSSSNEKIATVNANGRITGIAIGDATINISCGKVTKKISIKVLVKTTKLTVDKTYLVMKPGNTHQIVTTILPSEANQTLTYTSLDTKVVNVSTSGLIKALSVGSTTIVVSNGDQVALITVIVNKNSNQEEKKTEENNIIASVSDTNKFVSEIKNGNNEEEFELNMKDIVEVDSDILNALYGTNKTLKVIGDIYNVEVNGNDIKNADNPISTEIEFISTDQGLEFVINEGENLPGKIRIELNQDFEKYHYLYIYNESLEKWQYLNRYENGIITIDTPSTYLLTENKISNISIKWWPVIGTSLLMVSGTIIYILTKKKYWFW